MYALGVDLGTTWTAAAVWQDGRAETVALGDRAHTIPSVVFVEADGRAVAGEAAQRQRSFAPGHAAVEFKRRFGDDVPLLVGGRRFRASELTSLLLTAVLDVVDGRLGARPSHVVVTVPAGWLDYRHEVMGQVLRSCGLEEHQATILPEPVAAAVHYAGLNRVPPGSTTAVYDLGGGTFDATVVRKTVTGFEIVGVPQGGDVGGVDMDASLLDRLTRELGPAWSGLDHDDPATRRALVQLQLEITQGKEALSSSPNTRIPVVLPGGLHEVQVSRAQLESDVRPLVTHSIDLLALAISNAGLSAADLDRVLLVGGASRMPIVRRMLEERLPVPVAIDEHPKYAVCLGAAIAAGSRLEGAGIDWSRGRKGSVRAQPVPVGVAGDDLGTPAAIDVDLAASGLTGSADVPLRPAVSLGRPSVRNPNPAMTIQLGADEEYQTARRRGVGIGVSLLVVLALVALLLWTRR